ncbi:MAG: efflux RND transporter periplasmic adaptor subunit [Ignavibacteriales bacterium]|nr:efflux RND transporter periplasmic adaptor subunit [Ignavibacteriales bacterium]
MRFNIKFLLILSITAFIFFGCGEKKNEEIKEENQTHGKEEITLTSKAMKEMGIEIQTIKNETLTGLIKAAAKLIPNQDYEAQVGSLIQGRVHKVFVKEGDNVKAGQVLMQLEGLEIGELKAVYLKAKSNLDYYKAVYERQKTLIEQNIGSQKVLQEAKADYEKASAEFNAEDKRIHAVGLSHEDVLENGTLEHIAGILPIKSPINGIVTERNVVIGQLVEANTLAFKIMNISNLWADGQVYEKDISKLSGKPEIEFTTTAYPNEKFNGTTILIGQTVDERTRTIKYRASLQNKNNKLKPQMFGEMFIPVTGNVKGIAVPNDAIIKEGGKSFVFAALNDTTFSKKIVGLGNNLGDMTEIISGVSEGEKIVVKGAFFLKSELMKEMMKESD